MGTSRAQDGDLPIHRAAASGDIRVVEQLCNSEVVNLPGAYDKTALHYAVIGNNPPLVEFLLNHGADVNGGQSHVHRPAPLIEALSRENYEIANILLRFKANPEAEDEGKWRPLHFAAYYGRTHLARWLLDLACEPDPRTDNGETPLFLALAQNHTEITNLLWARDSHNMTLQLSLSGATYAHLAALRGRLDIVQQSINLDRSVLYKTDADGDDLLALAAASGADDIIDLLLRSGKAPDGINASRPTPLSRAAMNGGLKTVRILLSMGATVDQPSQYLRTALLWAVALGKLKTAHELLKAGANPYVQDAMVRYVEICFSNIPFYKK